MVTLKAEGEEDGKQVHLPVLPGAAVLDMCSEEEPVKVSAEAKLGSALCSFSKPAGSGCAVCGLFLQNFVKTATDITGKEDFLLFSSKVDCI